mmetsp:Transcript_14550/g.23650  ORF Transcript_14550/g.23650 Transcript_14550/m.23650 type:complete len:317 (-) Transcript_14550:311-1261(-)
MDGNNLEKIDDSSSTGSSTVSFTSAGDELTVCNKDENAKSVQFDLSLNRYYKRKGRLWNKHELFLSKKQLQDMKKEATETAKRLEEEQAGQGEDIKELPPSSCAPLPSPLRGYETLAPRLFATRTLVRKRAREVVLANQEDMAELYHQAAEAAVQKAIEVARSDAQEVIRMQQQQQQEEFERERQQLLLEHKQQEEAQEEEQQQLQQQLDEEKPFVLPDTMFGSESCPILTEKTISSTFTSSSLWSSSSSSSFVGDDEEDECYNAVTYTTDTRREQSNRTRIQTRGRKRLTYSWSKFQSRLSVLLNPKKEQAQIKQ